jgi:hypothetical protein
MVLDLPAAGPQGNYDDRVTSEVDFISVTGSGLERVSHAMKNPGRDLATRADPQ